MNDLLPWLLAGAGVLVIGIAWGFARSVSKHSDTPANFPEGSTRAGSKPNP